VTRPTAPTFTSPNLKTKLVGALARLIRQNRLTYDQFNVICREVRKEMELRRPRQSRRLPKLLPEASLKAFYEAVDKAGKGDKDRYILFPDSFALTLQSHLALNRNGVRSAMAHVLVHEITHLLEGVDRHSATGIMKARWSEGDYFEMRRKPLPFAQEDVNLIHAGLSASRAAGAAH
jgi:hypothetical protein